MFAPQQLFKVVHAHQVANGYFRGVRGMEALIVEDEGRRWAVQLQPSDEQFVYYELNGHWEEKGVTVDPIRFEVDFASMQDGEYHGQIGDLVASENGFHLLARSGAAGSRHVQHAFSLPGSQPQPSRPAICFRSWHIIAGPEDAPIELWSRPQ